MAAVVSSLVVQRTEPTAAVLRFVTSDDSPRGFVVEYETKSGLLRPRRVPLATGTGPGPRAMPGQKREEVGRVAGLKPKQAYRFRVAPVRDDSGGTCGHFSSWSRLAAPPSLAHQAEGDGATPEAKTEEPAAVLAASPPTPHLTYTTPSSVAVEWTVPLDTTPAAVTHVCVEAKAKQQVTRVCTVPASCVSAVVPVDADDGAQVRLVWLDSTGMAIGAEGAWSPCLFPTITPGVPALVRADTRQLVIRWHYPRAALPLVKHFELVVSSTAGAPAGGHRCTLPPVLPSNHTYHCIKHLHPAVEYKICVRALLADGTSSPYSQDSPGFRTLPRSAAVPAQNATADSITIAWPPPEREEEVLFYQLEYKSHGGHHTKVLSKVPLEDRCGCVVNGLLPATRYTFRARAVRESGPDSWTNNWSRFYSTVADTPAQKIDLLRQVSEESSLSARSYASDRSRSSSLGSGDAECCVM